MGILYHNSASPNLNKIDKIPEYAQQFRKEWMFIRGVNKEFKYFVDNIDEATSVLFQNHRVARIKKFIKRFLLAQERGRLQDTNNFLLKVYDVDNLIKIDKIFNNFYQFTQYKKDFMEEEYICPYPGFDDIYGDFNLFINKIKISEKVIYSRIASEIDSDSDSDINVILFNSDSDSDSDN